MGHGFMRNKGRRFCGLGISDPGWQRLTYDCITPFGFTYSSLVVSRTHMTHIVWMGCNSDYLLLLPLQESKACGPSWGHPRGWNLGWNPQKTGEWPAANLSFPRPLPVARRWLHLGPRMWRWEMRINPKWDRTGWFPAKIGQLCGCMCTTLLSYSQI